MFNTRLRYSLVGGIAIGVLATFGLASDVNAQELIRSNITPRGVNESNINTGNIRSNVIAPRVRSNLSAIADQLNTSVDALLSDDTIGQISLSPSGAEVLSSLQAADGITGPDEEGNFQVEQQVPRVGAETTGVASFDPPEEASVQNTLNLIEE